jgi:tetratricopeptide (TPR) repeat protein
MDPQIKRQRTLDTIKRIVLCESLNQPLVVIFEDLHWIDEQTQALLDLLADSIATAKILLLVNYRPEYSHQWNSKTYYTQLRLDPLGLEGAAEMLSALLGDGKDLIPLKRLITERTEGTPFFVEEIVQALFEDGVVKRNGVVKLAKSMKAVKVPATVQAVLAARIDRLPENEKELLQTIAVLGREFPLGLVRRVTLKPDDALERGLSRLQAGEFIYEQPAAGEVEYTFKHALTHEVAYSSLLIERRKMLHELAARALEETYGSNNDDYLNELARHYSRSGNLEKAVDYLRRAGEWALSRSLYREALDAFENALSLIDALANTNDRAGKKLRLYNLVAQALYPLEGWVGPRVEDALARALALVPLVNDSAAVQATLVFNWLFTYISGSFAEGKHIVDKMVEDAVRSGIPALIAKAHIPAANTYFYSGEFEVAARHGEEGVGLWRPEYYDAALWAGDPRALGLSFSGRALAALGFADQGLLCIQRALTFGKEQSSKFSYLIVLVEHTYWFPVLLRDLKLATWIGDEALRLLDELDPPDRHVFEAYAA